MDGGERAVAPPAQPHRFGSGGGVGGSEFFICFTSRLSSSSMRIPSSKSLPSPGRADKYRDTAAAAPSLSASLSRRLKSSGSVKGGQSPATIPAGGGSRRKSCAFEAAEPSSPKVTCIGQVKVKTARMKKKKKTLRSASQRAGRGGGEATFRRLEERGGEGEARDGGEDRDCLPNRNQSWGSICETLRAFGSEFNCFLPCGGGGRSHCASSAGAERGKGERTGGAAQGDGVAEKRDRGGGMGSCGAALARWLMAVQESDGVKRAEMVELVDGRGMAREVLVDAEKEGLVVKEESEGRLGGAAPLAAAASAHAPATAEDEGEAVCVPPPNALLLMRCRSDPVRMAALATRFWGSPAAARLQVEVDEEDHEQEEEEEEEEVADYNKDEPDGHDVLQNDGEEPGKAAPQGPEGGAQAAPASIVTETVLKGGPLAMADEEGSRISNREVESEAGKMLPLQGVEEQHCQGKGERDEGCGHCAEAAPELDKDDPSQEDGEEEAPKIEKAAAEKEDAAGLVGFPSPVVSTEQSELLLPASEQERAAAAGKEVAATKSPKPIFSSAELHGRRTSFSNDKDEGRRSSTEKGGRRHSFSTEKNARRTSSFRDKDGRRSSFSVASDFHRPSLCGEGEGRRRWSFSSVKEARRPVPVDTTAEAAAAAMDKKRRKKKKKEGEEEPGAVREDDIVVEVRSFERPIASAAAPAAAEAARRRGEKQDELPDCLLLMMYEPKLSMEVSRETWVCTSDFLRFRPHHNRQQTQPQPPPQPGMDAGADQGLDAGDGGAAENKAEVTASSDAVSLPHPPPPPPAPAPPTAPAPAPAATSPTPEAEKTPENKPASAAASSPFGLTRCKSEPMRSTAKMEPDACFWKSRHRPIGAAGIGF